LQRNAQETADRFDDQLVIFFRDFFKVIIWVLSALMILKYAFGYPLSHLFTALGIVGAALALAFRESLENLIASFIIFFDKPFTVGDLVKVENVTGTIEKIGLRSTRIRTLEKTFTTVPNKKMVDTIVDNLTLRHQRNVVTRLELGLQSTSVQIRALVAEIDAYLDDLEFVLDWNVYLSDTGQAAHIVHVEYFVSNDLEIKLFFKLREKVNLHLLDLVARHGVDLAATSNTRFVIAKEQQPVQ
jgi:MscS family membrane protein